jgi:translation initiation factor IF-3
LVQIRQPDNRLSPPEETKSVLRRIDRARYDLVLIVPPKKEGKGPEYPICVVVDRRAASEAARAKEKAEKEIKKANKSVLKELEINWAIAPHDLATKMKQLKKFLSKGYRVQLRLYNPKERSKRRATPEEAKEVHKVVLRIIAEVPGTANFKPTTGAVGQELIMYLQPSTKATGTAAAGGKASDETATVEVAEAAVVKEAGP